MGNFSPVFLNFHLPTRLVDVVKFCMNLTVDMGTASLTLQCFKDVSVFCKNGRVMCVMLTVSENLCVHVFHNYDFINDILLRCVRKISKLHPGKPHFISCSVFPFWLHLLNRFMHDLK